MKSGNVMIDADETIIYEFINKILYSEYFVNKLAEKFNVYLVIGQNEIYRTNSKWI